MNRVTLDGTVEPVPRDEILIRERRQETLHFLCVVDHEQDCQPDPIGLYSL